ncbi:pyrroline-5-carboxylate reductase [Clostridium cavendishii DSM 21758]|uniref:Pyrroline-5-carboxylate reductase n=1 Tax=Clostridium cavendishii DSM 21758 TaxID=1121302 RepID=A0A1M6TI66_9CLOT|nr:pyrroline-5-carboxylate reductase [Clostridium cavendishii]SHK56637.1 pyrroline-5-carboxylate reductase [Clostridium cavendishii DSM 21758]
MKIGFIGCGNMGKAMLGGIIKSGKVKNDDIMASAKSQNTIDKIKREFNVKTTLNNREVVVESNIIILAVKPYLYNSVIDEIKDIMDESKIIITIAAGITIDGVIKRFGKKIKVIKTMPNTPALVCEGMTAICHNENVTIEEKNSVIDLFKAFGKVEELEEKDFYAFTALCGSSPAYVFMFVEAMADAAVKQGIPRKKAYSLAAQAVLGSAKMILETEKHPGELKDAVCSPGGTTIEAVLELEKSGFRSSVINAMNKCEEKAKKM